MFRIIREINETIRMANAIADQVKAGERWTLFLTNRSFVAQVVATAFALLALFGVFLPVGAEDIVILIGVVGWLLGQLWSLAERLLGKRKTIWSRRQAYDALEEADALRAALKKAGAPVGN